MTMTASTAVPWHRPRGAEHPYANSADQLDPIVPVAGQPLRIGAVHPGTSRLELELRWSDATLPPLREPLTKVSQGNADSVALAGGDGHLEEAQAASLSTETAWTISLPALPEAAGEYRFVADDRASDWFELRPARWLPGGDDAVAGAGAKLVPGSVELLTPVGGAPVRARFVLALQPGDHLVGFGERFDAIDQAGRRFDSVVFEQYKSQGEFGRTYLPMPFAHVISADGSSWGFHVRTSRRVWFDAAASRPDQLLVEVELGAEAQVSVGLYDGSPTQVLTTFLNEVGRAAEQPDWVLRLWASSNEWNTQAIVTEQVARHHAEQIPLGVVVIEAWSDEQGFVVWRDSAYTPRTDGSVHSASDFTYPADGAWPDPAGMIADLHDQDIKLVLWQIPLLGHAETELTAETAAEVAYLAERGLAVREADGSPYRNRGWWFPKALMPDFTNPEARRWWQDRHRWLVRDLGVDGFKTDGGEHAWGADLRYADGRTGAENNNRYPVEYAAAFGELLESEGAAPITFSRAGYTGSQAHGLYWAGDENSTWTAFRHSLNAGITAAACGIVYWGWDIAGFSGPLPDPELYLRATAVSAFLPIMQYHSEFNHHRRPLRDRTPWNVGEAFGDEQVLPIFRSYAQLRERLVDYLARSARTAVRTDRPLLRGLFFDWPDDPQLWAHPHQFLCGDDLLVSPVTESGATEWTTWLPAGDWVDVWTGERLSGSAPVTRPVPLDVVPVYARAQAWPELAAVFGH
ncbi:galactose mutarotase-like protein [Propionicimonas paludicola]|uniref:Galactose mutarotase-like protein n=1 Tax=Propionicimonas paludicola TaxID=185243 RepID=A0A2A9CML2_9ACTN|nr:TIM-barrel domain-containing protein [Propionicimonas paludicola]PFG15558.1 galactose mutarotase-like protein [Propionicimonas paludicola]